MKNKKSKKVSDRKALKKSEILKHIADETGLTQKDIAAVFNSMTVLMKKNLLLKLCIVSKEPAVVQS